MVAGSYDRQMSFWRVTLTSDGTAMAKLERAFLAHQARIDPEPREGQGRSGEGTWRQFAKNLGVDTGGFFFFVFFSGIVDPRKVSCFLHQQQPR